MTEGMEARICYCDYEPLTLYRVKEPISRKEHRCCECGETIERGERYERADTLFEGIFESYATCLPCSRIRKSYCSPYTCLRETIWDHMGFDYVTGEWFKEED